MDGVWRLGLGSDAECLCWGSLVEGQGQGEVKEGGGPYLLPRAPGIRGVSQAGASVSPAAQARLGRLGSQTSTTRWPRAPPVLGVWCFPFLTASCQKPWDFHGRDLSCFRL